MVLNAVTISVLMLLSVCLLGPVELWMLHSLGFTIVESIEATLKLGGTEALVKGGIVTLILIVQPFIVGLTILKMVERIHTLLVVQKIVQFGLADLDKAGSRPKSRDQLHREVAEETTPPIASTFAHLAAASYEDIVQFHLPQFSWNILIDVMMFRGSRMHFQLIAITGIVVLLVYSFASFQASAYAMFLFLACLIGPSLFLYLAVLGEYASLTQLNHTKARIQQSRLYPLFKKAYYEVHKPFLGYVKRSVLWITVVVDYVLCYSFSYIEVAMSREKKEAANKQLDSERWNAEYNLLPALAKRLREIGESRNSTYSFRSNLLAYKIFQRYPLVLKMVQLSPVF